MSLHDSSELHDYAQSQPLVQPVDFVTCASEPAAAPAVVRHSRRRHT